MPPLGILVSRHPPGYPIHVGTLLPTFVEPFQHNRLDITEVHLPKVSYENRKTMQETKHMTRHRLLPIFGSGPHPAPSSFQKYFSKLCFYHIWDFGQPTLSNPVLWTHRTWIRSRLARSCPLVSQCENKFRKKRFVQTYGYFVQYPAPKDALGCECWWCGQQRKIKKIHVNMSQKNCRWLLAITIFTRDSGQLLSWWSCASPCFLD